MAKVALLVGVEGSSLELGPRWGAVNNVEALKQVLQHPEIGRFTEVKTLMNPDPVALQQAIETLFGDRQRDDLVLFYFSGQGLKSNQGKLYLTTSANRQDPQGRLARSAVVPASFIQDVMNSSQAHQQVVILDYWWAEALTVGETPTQEANGSTGLHPGNVKQQFGGQRQVVMIASTAVNGFQKSDPAELSAFTHYLIKGLRTGAADLDGDGVIAVGEWHEYTKQNLQASAPEIQSDLYAVKAGQTILLAQAPIEDRKLKYRQEVARRSRSGEISGITRGILEVVRDRLGLLPQEAAAIEAEILHPRSQSPAAPKTIPIQPNSRTKIPPIPQKTVTPLRASQKGTPSKAVAPQPASTALSESSQPQPVKVALLVGVSHYGPGFTPLPGTTSDVEGLKQVLQHPEKGGFSEVKTLTNPDPLALQQAIETLFGDRQRHDLVLFYFSGHGVKDDRGKLYLTTSSTRKTSQGRLFKSTAVPASFLQDVMSDSQSQRQVVILDCWFAGITENWLAEDGPVDIKNQFGGPGRVILTASTSTQSIFEQKGAHRSTYTDYLIEGLETGAADLDNDGAVAIHELHEYTRRKVQKSAPAAQPEIYGAQIGHPILLTKAPTDDVKLRYRKEVERCASYGGLSVVSRSILDVLREKLQLSPAEAATIEEQVLKPHQEYQKKLQRYAQVFVEAIQQEYPLQTEARSRFRRLQQVLGLRDEDVTLIEAQVARQVKGDQSLAQTNRSLEAPTPQSEPATPGRPLSSNPNPIAPTAPPKRSFIQMLTRQPWARFSDAAQSRVTSPTATSTSPSKHNLSSNTRLGLNLAGRDLWFPIGATAIALLALLGIAYGLQQSQGSQRLKTIQRLAQQKNYEECLRQAQALSTSSPAVQRLLEQCEARANWQDAKTQTLLESSGTVWSVAISPDGQTLVSGSGDQTIKIWNLQTGELRQTLSGHTGRVVSVAISPDGSTLVSGSNDATAKIWNLQTGKLRRTLSEHTGTVNAVAISPSGQTLASGSEDQTTKLWDLQTGELRRTLLEEGSDVYAIAFASDEVFVSSNKSGEIKVWQRS